MYSHTYFLFAVMVGHRTASNFKPERLFVHANIRRKYGFNHRNSSFNFLQEAKGHSNGSNYGIRNT